MRILRFLVFCFLVQSAAGITCSAQRNRTKKKDKEEKVSVDSLMRNYRYQRAVEVLEGEVEKATKKKEPVDSLELLLDKARSASVMLSGTEKVRFIDSMVVNKRDFINAYRISSDCGTLSPAKSVLPKNILQKYPYGETAYRNELSDRIYFGVFGKNRNENGLYVTERVGDNWGEPKMLRGVAGNGNKQDYPYMLSDGVTLYFSEESEDGLGGYDIYVTRYSSERGGFLKPENIGMPFNSPANDYLYVIDESNKIGWFATDRNQPEDKVCIYIFEPNNTREVYDAVAVGEDWVRNAAMLASIKPLLLDKVSMQKAQARLQKVLSEPAIRNVGAQVRYIINDEIVYTSPLQFKKQDAQNLALEWSKERSSLLSAEEKLEQLRREYKHQEATAEQKKEILEQERLVNVLREKVSALAKRMRNAELSK